MFFKYNAIMFRKHGFEHLKNLVTTRCDSCEMNSKTKRFRRQNTAYVDDVLNYTFECKNCHIEHESYWEERWAEYYGSIV
ncbi:hypothetical protein [Vagococcus fluvialis]|uniref:hypothetical protein n=1 Tax=Vagococcus fluvialis TaxID=2738 RepID=UPI001D09B05E|nr:hypothetical protein [Vagococcus fluvialis]UDM72703.1 hypothetical protein K5L00_15055 [Vagococcus fluvialis]